MVVVAGAGPGTSNGLHHATLGTEAGLLLLPSQEMERKWVQVLCPTLGSRGPAAAAAAAAAAAHGTSDIKFYDDQQLGSSARCSQSDESHTG